MPRLARLDAAGVLHHIMIRGIERRKILKDDKDRRNLIDRIKGDERMSGESDFASEVLCQAGENFERSYELKRQGYALKRVEQKVIGIFSIERDDIYSKGCRISSSRSKKPILLLGGL